MCMKTQKLKLLDFACRAEPALSLASSGIAFHSPGPREQSAQFTGRDLGLPSHSPDLGDI